METPECRKTHSQSKIEIVSGLPSSQAADGRRHRRAVCAYEKGLADGRSAAESEAGRQPVRTASTT